jgi:hypothetical protein
MLQKPEAALRLIENALNAGRQTMSSWTAGLPQNLIKCMLADEAKLHLSRQGIYADAIPKIHAI